MSVSDAIRYLQIKVVRFRLFHLPNYLLLLLLLDHVQMI